MSTSSYKGAARQRCLLDQHEKQGRVLPWHPPGLVGFEIQLGAPVHAALAALIPTGSAGRDLFVARPEDLLVHDGVRSRRPWPTVPLLVRATPDALRVLSLCAPAEAHDVGQRVALLAAAALPVVATVECAPAVLADLIGHYLDRAAAGEALCDPNVAAPEAGRVFMSWVGPWPRERLLHGRPQRLLGGAAGLPLLQRRSGGGPVTLVPVALLVDPPGVHEGLLAAVLSRPGLLAPLIAGTGYSVVPSRTSPLMVSLLLPLRAESWRTNLLRLREELSRALRTSVGFFSVLHRDVLAMAQKLRGTMSRLAGADQLAPPRPTTAQAPFDAVHTLCAKIMEALEVRLDVEVLREAG